MDREQLRVKVETWFKAHKSELIEDLKALIRCPSISDPTSDVKPFGAGCRQAMDTMEKLAHRYGFETRNYDYNVLRVGGEKKSWENTVGFWGHLDVVPVGANWTYKPFDPVYEDGYVIGRGATDNKAAIIGTLYMLRCLKELNIELQHDFCMFMGCDEERAMEDISYFRTHYSDMPKINIVTDCLFPVCFGEKGIVEGELISEKALSDSVVALCGGNASNMVPDSASLTIKKTAEAEKELTSAALPENIAISIGENTIAIVGAGISRHSAFPVEGSPNAIHELARFAATLTSLTETDRNIFAAIAEGSEDYFGQNTGIAFSDELSGKLTSVLSLLHTEDAKAIAGFNIRYSISADPDVIVKNLNAFAKGHDCTFRVERINEPNYFPKEHPLVDALTNLYNEITGADEKPYVMPGGTYARKLPNAFGFGPGRRSSEEMERMIKKFGPGRGTGHCPDECADIDELITEMVIYSLCVVEMNHIDL